MSGHDAAIAAMNTLLRPIIVTLVLMSVFLPAAFVPGLTGRMYAQFALVIAATPLLSAINAVTLKPTQAVLWLRPPIPEERRNFFYRGFKCLVGIRELKELQKEMPDNKSIQSEIEFEQRIYEIISKVIPN